MPSSWDGTQEDVVLTCRICFMSVLTNELVTEGVCLDRSDGVGICLWEEMAIVSVQVSQGLC